MTSAIFNNKVLIQHFKDRNFDGISKIIDDGFDVNSQIPEFLKGTLLADASKINDKEMVDFLIGKGADIQQDHFAVAMSAYHGHTDLLKFFIEHGADINIDNHDNPLLKACDNNKFECVKILVEHGADVNIVIVDKEQKETLISEPLYKATIEQNVPMVNYLIEHGAKITEHVLFGSAFGEGDTFKNYVFNHKVEISDKLKENIKAFDLTGAMEILSKKELNEKLSFNLSDKPKQPIKQKIKQQGMKI